MNMHDYFHCSGVFLPVFDILMKRIERVENVTTKLQRLFRDFWQICVVMNFVTRGRPSLHATIMNQLL